MARLPIPGSDTNNWGALLNEFLRVAHREDGTIRNVPASVNIIDFGAIGDGVADDTSALQTAINSAQGQVLVIDRPLRITDPASITNTLNSYIRFEGLGRLITDFVSLKAITIMSPGSGYKSIPTALVVSSQGSGATISIALGGQQCSVSTPGSGYNFRSKVEVNGGIATEKMLIEITGKNGAGNALTARVIRPGKYSALPANPVTVTTIEDTGSGATFNITWHISEATVSSAGVDYITEPTIIIAGDSVEPAEVRPIGNLIQLQGVVDAAPVHIFDGYAGTGSFSDRTPVLYPQWWGATPGGVDCRTAFQKCMDSAFQKMVYVPSGTYYVSGYMTPPAICTLRGDGRNSTIFQPLVDTDIFRITAGFDLYISDMGILDPRNLQSLSSTAFFFDNRLSAIQRVFISNILMTGARAFANNSFEAFPVFGVKIRDVSAYIRGAFCEFFYTTGMELFDCLSEHIDPLRKQSLQDQRVLRDFWFYGNDADLGGGLVLTNCISRVPSNFGIVIEGPGNGHCWERFLQAWLRNCSTDNSGKGGVLIRRGEQIHIENGYYALAHNNNSVIALDTDIRNITINNATVAAGSYCKILITAASGVVISNSFIYEGDSAGILIDGASSDVFGMCRNILIIGNLITGNREGVRLQNDVDDVSLSSNSWYTNSARPPLYNAASGQNIILTGNM